MVAVGLFGNMLWEYNKNVHKLWQKFLVCGFFHGNFFSCFFLFLFSLFLIWFYGYKKDQSTKERENEVKREKKTSQSLSKSYWLTRLSYMNPYKYNTKKSLLFSYYDSVCFMWYSNSFCYSKHMYVAQTPALCRSLICHMARAKRLVCFGLHVRVLLLRFHTFHHLQIYD